MPTEVINVTTAFWSLLPEADPSIVQGQSLASRKKLSLAIVPMIKRKVDVPQSQDAELTRMRQACLQYIPGLRVAYHFDQSQGSESSGLSRY